MQESQDYLHNLIALSSFHHSELKRKQMAKTGKG